jgi:hypothetical protein
MSQETKEEFSTRIQSLLDDHSEKLPDQLYIELCNLLKKEFENSINLKQKVISLELLDELVQKREFHSVQDLINFLIEYKEAVESVIELLELDDYTVIDSIRRID